MGDDILAPKSAVHSQSLIQKLSFHRIYNRLLGYYLRGVRGLIPKSLRNEVFISTSIGERHKIIYDEMSLARLLREAGFHDIRRMGFDTSALGGFSAYLLDVNEDGSPYKGVSSLYMECGK